MAKTIEQVAREVGVRPDRIRQLVRRNLLDGKRGVMNSWELPDCEYVAYRYGKVNTWVLVQPKPVEPMLTPIEAAAIMGVTPRAVRRLCSIDAIEHTTIGRSYHLIPLRVAEERAQSAP